jgi:hypothetical protein
MKEVREERFTKKEDVGFNPPPIPKTPAPRSGSGVGESGERSNERTNVTRVREERSTATAYVVTLPLTRRKTRQSFDIFEDQYDALKKIKLAEEDQERHQHSRKMGDMVQEALDAFITEKAQRLGISIRRAHE